MSKSKKWGVVFLKKTPLPRKDTYREVVFYTSLAGNDGKYYLAMQEHIPIERSVIESCQVISFESPYPVDIEEDESVYIDYEGNYFIANETVPISKAQRKIIFKEKNRNIAISDADLINLPGELNVAVKEYSKLEIKETETKFFEICPTDDYYNRLDQLLNRIQYKELLGVEIKTHKRKFENIDWENPIYTKCPCLFRYPFFLNPTRTTNYSVIPIGKQTHISLCVHKNTPVYMEYKKYLDGEILIKRGHEGEDIENYRYFEFNFLDEELSIAFLKQFIIQASKERAAIYTMEGFIFSAILADFSLHHKIEEFYFKTGRRISISDVKNMFSIGAKPSYNQYDIIALDPMVAARYREYTDIDREKFDIINLKHGVNVSVGLGFSLPMLPLILKNRNWENITNKITPTDNAILQELFDSGIHINNFSPTESPITHQTSLELQSSLC